MARKKLITIVGNIGAGKSTLTDLLEIALPAKKVPADSLYKISPFFPLAMGDRVRWSLTSDLWFLYERVKLAREIPIFLKKTHVVVDTGLPMSWVYARSRVGSGYYTKDEWQLYQALHGELVDDTMAPDILIYLKAPVAFLRNRIKQRAREFELRYYTREYLTELGHNLGLMASNFKRKGVKVISFRADKKDFVGKEADLTELIRVIRE